MEVDCNKIERVVYSFVVADLFHYGHLQLLKTAKEAGDLHICGVLSDEAVAAYKHRPVANFEERKAVISSICYVDRVVEQTLKDPTENLQAIHAEFPGAVLVLIHGDDWRDVPGREFVESVGGKLIQPEYYKRLADSRIQDEIFTSKFQEFELFTEHFRIDGISFFNPKPPKRLLSTKANTLKLLRPLLKKARIEKAFVFRAGDYDKDRIAILDQIQENFLDKVVVRSSAIDEDTELTSRAGYYESVLDVPVGDRQQLAAAVEGVLDCYSRKGLSNEYHQVLVQKQTENVRLSGVIFTQMPDTCAPYYLINYDDSSGRTDTVTAGLAGQTMIVAKTETDDLDLGIWEDVLAAVKEIESLIPGLALDIEFGVDRDDSVVIYQVRPLVIANQVRSLNHLQAANGFAGRLRDLEAKFVALSGHGLSGDEPRAAFSDMAFWNPAEIIGDQSNTLAYSLYKRLITDGAWNTGLLPLGYTEVADQALMCEFGGKAYIDLRKTFHALLPAEIAGPLRTRLVKGSLAWLQAHPELHDKVEFEVLDSCFLFDFAELQGRYRAYGLGDRDYETFTSALTRLTDGLFRNFEIIAQQDLAAIEGLAERRQRINREVAQGSPRAGNFFNAALELLGDCATSATPVFARQARVAFIANALLLSMKRKGYLSEQGYALFLQGLETIASEFHKDFQLVLDDTMDRQEFVSRYGHLRPNTYDINSVRYDRAGNLFHADRRDGDAEPAGKETGGDLLTLVQDPQGLEAQLRAAGFDMSLAQLAEFIKCGLETREKIKFEFTKNISDALEFIAQAGERLGMSRMDLARLTIDEIGQVDAQAEEEVVAAYLQECSSQKASLAESQRLIVLPPILFSEKDFYLSQQLKAKPNFITRKKIGAPLFFLESTAGLKGDELDDKIVLIESADPGYDWIFTKRIRGLITRFGGLASHMAIRCAEFGLPAAIGCGDGYFAKLRVADWVELDCQLQRIVTSRHPESLA